MGIGLTRLKDQYQALAEQLGLKYKPGIDAILSSEAMKRQIVYSSGNAMSLQQLQSVQKATEIFQNPLIKKLLEKLFPGFVTGNYRDHEVFIYPRSEGKRSAYSMHFVLAFKTPLKLGLSIYTESFFSRVAKSLFKAQDIQTGNAELDKLVMIKGKDQAEVQVLLSDHFRQKQLTGFFRKFPSSVLDDFGIQHTESSAIVSASRATEMLDALLSVGEGLNR